MSRPQDNPKEQKRMSKQTDGQEQSESETMSQTDTDHERDELHVAMKSETVYWVGNENEDTLYTVDLTEEVEGETIETCTCPDYRYRVSPDENRACKHILAVIEAKPSEITVDRMAYDGLTRQYDMLDDKLNSVMQRLTSMQSEPAVSSQERDVPASDAAGDGQQMAEVSAQEGAEKLQEAFDAAVTGMNTLADDNGRVWVNKSPDAPDYTFGAFLRDPELMKYDPDNSPEQYYKNYIDASDVDEYISEVLE